MVYGKRLIIDIGVITIIYLKEEKSTIQKNSIIGMVAMNHFAGRQVGSINNC